MIAEAFKAELVAQAHKGRDSKALLDLQKEVIASIKSDIAREMAEASIRKTRKTTRFLFWTFTSETLEGIDELEKLAAELQVITAYEDALNANINIGEAAKLNLESINERY